MDVAFGALLHPAYELEPRATNAFSKFILVHALHVRLNLALRQASHDGAPFGFGDLGHAGGAPVARHGWTGGRDGSARTSRHNSDSAVPPNRSGSQSPAASPTVRAVSQAFERWKQMWDADMPLQYPPDSKRSGFCRDGVHFYWLARAMLRSPHAPDPRTSPDLRFMQVMKVLKQIGTWVALDNAARGEEVGSVAAIDDSYGVEDLTLDMSLLFKPLDE
jgi:hypothetical protein